jgi:TolA-binding protein
MLSLDKLLGGVTISSNKPISSIPNEPCKTLEAYHQSELEKIRDQPNQMSTLQVRLSTLQGELAQKESNLSLRMQLDLTTLKQCEAYEREIEQLQTKMKRIASGEEEADYFLKVGEILFSYADARERIAKGEHTKEVKKTKEAVDNGDGCLFCSS